MIELLNNPIFGILLSIISFEIGVLIYKKTKLKLFNPLLVSIIISIMFLLFFNINIELYEVGGNFINFFLGPATVLFAVPLYKQIDSQLILSMLPKSITTPIGIELSSLIGGIPSITVISIMVTGNTGVIIADSLLKLFKIDDEVAVGIAYGTSAHALGTSKAMEIGEEEGAMSSLSIGIAGLITVFIVPLFIALFNI